jgi:regulator of sirC expression with transglutaminase-like and TPR domain
VDFEAVARAYRAEAVKPALPEAARRWRVQAESAVRAQQFDEAADLFDAALAEAPWWPEGHFNRALVLGEAGAPAGAITEMRRYLALVPEAPDARAAQDKIYEWERQVPAPALPAATPAAGK